MLSQAQRRSILDTSLRIFWDLDGSKPERVAGHAYLIGGSDPVRLLHLVHSEESTPAMVELSKEWAALHPDSRDRREWTNWYPPRSSWSLTLDAGAVAKAIGSQTVVHEQLVGRPADAALRAFPQEFLRDPVRTLVRELAGEIEWPAHLGAHVLRPRFHHAASGGTTVITGCRYGSAHADSGQDRTAAVFLSRERGGKWQELPWNLPVLQRLSPSGRYSWPPEQIDRVEIVQSEDMPAPRIEFEDPWIVFEPGKEWRATWMPRKHHWVMQGRSDPS
jgi:hypothetical protein